MGTRFRRTSMSWASQIRRARRHFSLVQLIQLFRLKAGIQLLSSAPNSFSAFSTLSIVALISSSVSVRSGARSVMA